MGVRDTIAKAIMGIKAYHSSPHDFDKFDLKKIGTGEGTQVYGHGLYFAENPAVSGQGGQYWKQFKGQTGNYNEQMAAEHLQQAGFDNRLAADRLQQKIDELSAKLKSGNYEGLQVPRHGTTREFNEEVLREHQFQRDLMLSGKPVGPRTYEVNIKADPAQMLNWDKSMSAQPEVMDKIRPLFSDYRLAPSNYLGESVHKEIRDFHMGQGMSKPAAAEATAIDLRSSGIPGIKYLDAGSRAIQPAITDIERAIKQGGVYKGASPDMWASRLDEFKQTPLTNNYVVFDPANIDILKKYGVAAMPTGALAADQMGSTFDQRYYGAQ